MLYKIFYQLGVYFRNPSIHKIVDFLHNSEKWSFQEIESYQLSKINELVTYANKYCPYYQQQFRNLSLHHFKSFEEFKQIPILTKDQLLNYNQQIHSIQKFKNCKKASTSGSSGTTLQFKRDEWADSFNRATIFYNYSKYGVKPWNKNGYFWGFNFSWYQKNKTRLLDKFQHRFRIFSYENKSFQDFVKKLSRVKYIHGYSSMIYQTALLINDNQLPKPKKIKMVKGTSEKIFEKYQFEIVKAFGVKMISEYGATESGIIAFECPNGNMHINMQGVYVEEIDNEIIITNLQMKSFPIIRYQLGDYIELEDQNKKCACGSNHRILKEVTGRIGNNVYGKMELYPSLYFYYIFKNLAKNYHIHLNFQVHQKQKGDLIFLIEQDIDIATLSLVKSEIEKYFKNDMDYDIKTNQTIRAGNGKLKSFISTID